MGLTTNHNDPGLKVIKPDGQQENYLVLSDEERAKGFVNPVRTRYRHLYCGGVTTMGLAISETYARNPKFYSGTFCAYCGQHFQLGSPWNPAFVWELDGAPVGSTIEEAEMYSIEKKAKEAKKHLGENI